MPCGQVQFLGALRCTPLTDPRCRREFERVDDRAELEERHVASLRLVLAVSCALPALLERLILPHDGDALFLEERLHKPRAGF